MLMFPGASELVGNKLWERKEGQLVLICIAPPNLFLLLVCARHGCSIVCGAPVCFPYRHILSRSMGETPSWLEMRGSGERRSPSMTTCRKHGHKQTGTFTHTHKQSKHETYFSSKRYIGKGPRLLVWSTELLEWCRKGGKAYHQLDPPNNNLSEQPGVVML